MLAYSGMVGDVNLYLNDADEPTTGEIEIMIAEEGSRRKGIAYEALTLFMAYCVKHLGISCFQAKIGFSNAASLRLFGRLGYVEVSRSQMFKEATLRLEVSGTVREALQQQAEKLQLSIYDIS
ncbi:hypothetical protein ABBQ32_000977 [Trebouxia sp. C0010 RCD-2024]